MTRYIRNRLRMLRATVAHFDEHPDAWSAKPPVVRALAPIRDAHATLEAAATAQAEGDTTGLTEDKGDARDDATTGLVTLGKRVTAYAVEIGDDDLRAALDHSRSDWDRFPDDVFYAQARRALNRAEPLLTALTEFEVTAEQLTAVRADLAEFVRIAGLRDTTDASGTAATEDLDTVYSNAVKPLKQLDRVVDALVADPAFVAQYHVVRRIPGD
ncbi:hypothetical protein [Rubrivirga sp. IMCC45206]|uniref:hypothetical protein n=1 Tax=Rubrivirga sp. IMCC45206 TaxID=3391614 RepID=UPI00398F9D41